VVASPSSGGTTLAVRVLGNTRSGYAAASGDHLTETAFKRDTPDTVWISRAEAVHGHRIAQVFASSDVPVAVDLFAGCGGLTEGLLASGIDVAASVELHPQPALTHAFNHPSTAVFVGDVRGWSSRLVEPELDRRSRTRVDLVVGGPPCQGFSSAGKKKRTDPRNSLFRSFQDLVADLRPRMFMLENVPGFQNMFDGMLYQEAVREFRQLGYDVNDTVLAAADFGVPQRRRRFIMVGWLPDEAKPFEFPLASGEARVSAHDAIGDLDFLRPGFEATRYTRRQRISDYVLERRADNVRLFNHLATRHRSRAVTIMEAISEGRSIRDVDATVRSAKRTMSRLHRHEIANTVLSLPDDMIHYKHHRILTVRENARLQTFDDDFVFFGKRTSGFVERRVDVPQYTQVGNAVPPLLGLVLGRALVKSLGYPIGADLRDLGTRRRRHEWVRGSSGYAGYVLDPEAARELQLRSVDGETLTLPLDDEEKRVATQLALRDWTSDPRPRRTQWAPGVVPKDQPAWFQIVD
jgi:DNA (cytosine-5)-methyltransferase 1